jgi:hypothetical protein
MPVIVVTRLRLKEPASWTSSSCGEATFVDWEQATSDLPDWQTSYGRLVADGQVATLTNPSEAQ